MGVSPYFERQEEEARPKPAIGDRVIVQKTLLYNDKKGTLQAVPGPPEDWNLASWDFHVLLDDGRIIGVDRDQVRLS
jgi:hypothetical protein